MVPIGRLSYGCCGMRFGLSLSNGAVELGEWKVKKIWNKERGWFTWSKCVHSSGRNHFYFTFSFSKGRNHKEDLFRTMKKRHALHFHILRLRQKQQFVSPGWIFWVPLKKRSTLFSCRHFWILRFAQDRQMKKYEVPKFPKNHRIWWCLDSQVLGPVTLPPTWFNEKWESSLIESLNLSSTYSHFPRKNDDYGRKSKLHSVFWDLISTPRGREVDVFYPSHPTTFALIFPFGDDFSCTPQKTNTCPENRWKIYFLLK